MSARIPPSLRRVRALGVLATLALLGCPSAPVPASSSERPAGSASGQGAPDTVIEASPSPPSQAAAPAEPAVEPAPPDAPPPRPLAPPIAGITWDPPPGFVVMPPANPMRVAEYATPDGDARLAVFHFPEMRETVRANLERWKSQFDERARQRARVETRGVAGFSVSILDIAGANAGMHGLAGPGGGVAPPREERLLGAAIVAPGGIVFFKLTGPRAAFDADVEASFEAMVASLRPAPPAPEGAE